MGLPESLDASNRKKQKRQGRFQGPQPATVRRVSSDGVRVSMDRADDNYLVGPCKWSSPDGSTPPAGTRCLVLHAPNERGERVPWIIAFDRWPS